MFQIRILNFMLSFIFCTEFPFFCIYNTYIHISLITRVSTTGNLSAWLEQEVLIHAGVTPMNADWHARPLGTRPLMMWLGCWVGVSTEQWICHSLSHSLSYQSIYPYLSTILSILLSFINLSSLATLFHIYTYVSIWPLFSLLWSIASWNSANWRRCELCML